MESKEGLFVARLKIFNEMSASLANRLVTESITLEQWEQLMRKEIKGMHASALSIGRETWNNPISNKLVGKMGADLKRQYGYLHDFSLALRLKADYKEEITPDFIVNRALMYGKAAKAELIRGELGESLGFLVPAIPGDGQCICMSNCNCHWRRVEVGTEEFDLYWEMGTGKHCETCSYRFAAWYPLKIRGSIITNYDHDLGPMEVTRVNAV